VAAESLAVPADHSLGLDDDRGGLPARPAASERDPEVAIEWGESRSRVLLSVDGELLPKSEFDDGLILAAAEQSGTASDDRDPESEHHSHHRSHSARDRWAKRRLNLARGPTYALETSALAVEKSRAESARTNIENA
jgi:hypothetical protein